MKSDKFMRYLSFAATTMAILMYVSYIAQIADNLSGSKGTPIQPLVATISCSLWMAYGVGKKPKDWPIIIANFPGIIFGLIAFLTAL